MPHIRTALPVLLAALGTAATGTAQAAWQRLYPAQLPPPAAAPMMTCMEFDGDLVAMFDANINFTAMLCWTKSLRGGWAAYNGPAPTPRDGAVMAYDPIRDCIILFGGSLLSVTNNEHWEYHAIGGWGQRTLATRPPHRHQATMAFDRSRGVMVLYGGERLAQASQPALRNDVWEFNGNTWTQRTTGAPSGRRQATMAFDPVGGTMLMFGGILATSNAPTQPQSYETWTYDGTSWTLHTPNTPPDGGPMATDLDRARVLMPFGQGSPYAWEWDGSQWRMLLQASPGLRSNPGVAYEPHDRRILMWGGMRNGVPTDEFWEFSTAAPAELEAYGSGCAGSSGVPQLNPLAYQLPWIGDTTTVRLSNLDPSVAAVVFVAGTQATSVGLGGFGMPGCTQLLVPQATNFRLASQGRADWSMQIPNNPALAGVEFRAQAFALDAGANAAGVCASKGLRYVVGIR
jgi:hypothetical protein